MQLQDVMTREIYTIAADATLQQAAERMAAHDVGFLPVIKDGLRAGVVTDRDIVVRGVARGDDPRQTPVERAMTPQVETIKRDASVMEAAQRMREKQIRRLLVEDFNGQLVGVVTLGDLAVEVPGTQLGGHQTADGLAEVSP